MVTDNRHMKDLLIELRKGLISSIDTNTKMNYHGLCSLNKSLFVLGIIGEDDYIMLRRYIYANKPRKRNMIKKLILGENKLIDPSYTPKAYFWPQHETKYRIKWLNHHIKKLSN